MKTNNIRDVLSQLDDVYCNDDPKNNLGDKSIGPDMINKGYLSGQPRQVKRASQTGAQCGIHSSKRILPAHIYQNLNVNDCDISGILEAV